MSILVTLVGRLQMAEAVTSLVMTGGMSPRNSWPLPQSFRWGNYCMTLGKLQQSYPEQWEKRMFCGGT